MPNTDMHLSVDTLAIVGAILTQTGLVAWWASNVNTRVGRTEEDVKEIKREHDNHLEVAEKLKERVNKAETANATILVLLGEIKARLHVET